MWELCSYLLSPLLARLKAPVFCVLCCMSPMSYVHALCGLMQVQVQVQVLQTASLPKGEYFLDANPVCCVCG
jgi:hypothetical protein